MIKLFFGIDAGISGAIVALDEYGDVVAWRTLPHYKGKHRSELDGDKLASWITSEVLMPTHCQPHQCAVVAEESPSYGMGSVSAYTSGYNNGRLHECLRNTFHRRPQRIRPQDWQLEIYQRKLTGADDNKAISIARAKESHGEMSGAFNVKKYADGISDALHIAEYCRRLQSDALKTAKKP